MLYDGGGRRKGEDSRKGGLGGGEEGSVFVGSQVEERRGRASVGTGLSQWPDLKSRKKFLKEKSTCTSRKNIKISISGLARRLPFFPAQKNIKTGESVRSKKNWRRPTVPDHLWTSTMASSAGVSNQSSN